MPRTRKELKRSKHGAENYSRLRLTTQQRPLALQVREPAMAGPPGLGPEGGGVLTQEPESEHKARVHH